MTEFLSKNARQLSAFVLVVESVTVSTVMILMATHVGRQMSAMRAEVSRVDHQIAQNEEVISQISAIFAETLAKLAETDDGND